MGFNLCLKQTKKRNNVFTRVMLHTWNAGAIFLDDTSNHSSASVI